MRKIVFAVLACAFAVTPCFSQAVAEGVPVTKEGREVFAAITKWADAVRSRDMKALDSLFEEDLIITNFDGTTRGKKKSSRP